MLAMANPKYVVVNEKNEFYCEADGDPWSADEAHAECFLVLTEAQAIAEAKNGYVLPKLSDILSRI